MEVVVTLLYQASKLLLMLALLITLWRLWLGPTIFERVLALESIALVVVAYLLTEANADANRLYIDAALGLALCSVVGTIFLGFFLGRGDFPDE